MKIFMLTFDVEKNCPPYGDGYEGVKVGLPRVLDMLDELGIKTTMFVTGRSAELYPKTIKRAARKHEIQCHTYEHETLEFLNYDEQKETILKCRKVLEDLTGKTIDGFRAPYLRFNKTTFKVLHDLGFRYDSSVMIRSIASKGITNVGKINRNILRFLLYPEETIGKFNSVMLSFLSKPKNFLSMSDKERARLLYYTLISLQKLPRRMDSYIEELGLEEVKITLRSAHFRLPTFNPRRLRRDVVVAYLHPWEFIELEEYLNVEGLLLFRWLFSGKNLVNVMKKRLMELRRMGYKFVTISEYLNKFKS